MAIEHSFLKCFGLKHTFCAIDDKKVDQIPKHFHDGFDLSQKQILDKLHFINKTDYGIFFCVNEIDRAKDPQKHRTSKMLNRIRAVWADDDLVRPEPRSDFPIPPNIVVETSPGKFHYYWLTTTDDIETWGFVMNGIANTYNTDGNAKDLVRVLRLPGFLHHKHESFRSKAYIGDATPYAWNIIAQAFPPDTEAKHIKSDGDGTHANAKFSSFAEARTSIVEGTNFHGAIMWTLNHWVNCGMKDPDELQALVVDLLSQSTVQDERWELRMNPDYLALNVRDALQFVKDNPIHSDVVVPEVDDEQHQLNVGYPPGLMGVLCEEIYEMAPHPNEEVALMAGFALVAGILGRSYNVLGTGLNLYVALLADSGVGKANLKNSINTALMVDCAMEGGVSFKGASRFTGPKPLFEMLLAGLSRVCVLEESGLMSESTAGDQKGLSRVMLDIYSSSGKGEYAGGENYSKQEQNVPVIPSPALTIAHVSTPLSYLKALKAKDAAVSGDIARVWMMRSMRDKAPLNISRRTNFSEPVIARIKELVKKCAPQQSTESGDVTDVDISYIDIRKDSDVWTAEENKYKHDGDNLRRAITSRAFVKIMKISSISSIFNGHMGIDLEDYKWATSAIHGEIAMIEEALSYGSSDDMMVIVRGVVMPAVSKILGRKFSSPQKCPPKALMNKGIFTGTNLTQVLRNNEVIKRMNDDPERPNPRSGLEKIIAYMTRSGLLTSLAESQLITMGTKVKVAYKVTDEFLELMGNEE